MNAGLQRINEILNEPGITRIEETRNVIPAAGEVLRMVANIVARFRESSASMPKLEAQVQEALVTTLSLKFTAIHELLALVTNGPSTGVNLTQVSETTIFLARIIQFILGFPEIWTPSLKNQSEPLCGILVKLALVGSLSQNDDFCQFLNLIRSCMALVQPLNQ